MQNSNSTPPSPPNGGTLNYPQYLDNAMALFLQQLLGDVAQYGFPGEHHLYIAFRTTLAGVEMPSSLRRQYPEEMRIVLQHRFRELLVDENCFAVTLEFAGRSERIVVPFTAVTEFNDPSVADVRYHFSRHLNLEGDTANLGEKARPSETSETPPPKVHVAEDSGPLPGDENASVVELDQYRARRSMRTPTTPPPPPTTKDPA